MPRLPHTPRTLEKIDAQKEMNATLAPDFALKKRQKQNKMRSESVVFTAKVCRVLFHPLYVYVQINATEIPAHSSSQSSTR
jgi:hypothetical protein